MTPERWQQVCDLFEQALEVAPQQRPALLDRVCGADRSLRQDIQTSPTLVPDRRRGSAAAGPPGNESDSDPRFKVLLRHIGLPE